MAIAGKKEETLAGFGKIGAGAKKSLVKGSLISRMRVSWLNPSNAAEACQLATTLNREALSASFTIDVNTTAKNLALAAIMGFSKP